MWPKRTENGGRTSAMTLAINNVEATKRCPPRAGFQRCVRYERQLAVPRCNMFQWGSLEGSFAARKGGVPRPETVQSVEEELRAGRLLFGRIGIPNILT
eukprot:scaffold178_cov255-Pinguiococcus_pyrenoidosus.AAC.2